MELNANLRQLIGNHAKKLRSEFLIPAVVYGLGNPSINLEVGYNEFVKLFREAGETTLVTLKFDGKTKKVLVKDIQKDPVSGKVIHASFLEVNLKVKIKAMIPVVVEGEEESPVLKSGTGILNLIKHEIEVEALPADLPHSFTVNVSALENIGDEIKVSALEFDRTKVELVDLTEEDLILNIDAPQEEVTEEATLTEEERIAALEASSEKPESEESSEEEK
jgi:large subunit ribosomal protein L25